jgi:hypothetical protein
MAATHGVVTAFSTQARVPNAIWRYCSINELLFVHSLSLQVRVVRFRGGRIRCFVPPLALMLMTSCVRESSSSSAIARGGASESIRATISYAQCARGKLRILSSVGIQRAAAFALSAPSTNARFSGCEDLQHSVHP